MDSGRRLQLLPDVFLQPLPLLQLALNQPLLLGCFAFGAGSCFHLFAPSQFGMFPGYAIPKAEEALAESLGTLQDFVVCSCPLCSHKF